MKYTDIVPLSKVIKQTMQELDEREWSGDFSKSKQLNLFLCDLKDLEAKGDIWYPLF